VVEEMRWFSVLSRQALASSKRELLSVRSLVSHSLRQGAHYSQQFLFNDAIKNSMQITSFLLDSIWTKVTVTLSKCFAVRRYTWEGLSFAGIGEGAPFFHIVALAANGFQVSGMVGGEK